MVDQLLPLAVRVPGGGRVAGVSGARVVVRAPIGIGVVVASIGVCFGEFQIGGNDHKLRTGVMVAIAVGSATSVIPRAVMIPLRNDKTSFRCPL
jgi:hypothetical protein